MPFQQEYKGVSHKKPKLLRFYLKKYKKVKHTPRIIQMVSATIKINNVIGPDGWTLSSWMQPGGVSDVGPARQGLAAGRQQDLDVLAVRHDGAGRAAAG